MERAYTKEIRFGTYRCRRKAKAQTSLCIHVSTISPEPSLIDSKSKELDKGSNNGLILYLCTR